MKVFFRVDASETVGFGHLVRCLVLADAIAARGGECTLLLRNVSPHTAHLLKNTEHAVCALGLSSSATSAEDAQASMQAIQPMADWLVVDHYGLDASWESAIRTRTKRLLAIDDLADRSHDCDVLVDPGLGRQPVDYSDRLKRQSIVLLGTKYALLRQEFAQFHNTAPSWPKICRAHVFFGGGDPTWLPRHVEVMLRAVPALKIFAVGAADEVMMTALLNTYADRVTWRPYVVEMALSYLECDVAIGSPGTATWERACVGLPAGVVATASNQVPILKNLERLGFCRYLGEAWALDESGFARAFEGFLHDQAALSAMRSFGVAAVDGKGAQRIAEVFFQAGGS